MPASKFSTTWDATEVPVYENLSEVQQSGRVNMYDRKGVLAVAQSEGLCDLMREFPEELGEYTALLIRFGAWLREAS